MNRLLFFLFCMAFVATAMGQKNYDEAIYQGDTALFNRHYNNAIKKYFAAAAFDPTKKNEVQSKIDTVYIKIIELKNDADNQKGLVETALKNLKKQTSIKETALTALRAQQVITDSAKQAAEDSADSARAQRDTAKIQKTLAENATKTSDSLQRISYIRYLANKSIVLMKEKEYFKSKDSAIKAFHINDSIKGPNQNNDIYNALNINWASSIKNKNISSVHQQPVHSIAATAKSNIIFSADEDGLIYSFTITEGEGLTILKPGLNSTKGANYPVAKIKEEVRAIEISPDGTKLIVITSNGSIKMFNISGNNLSEIKTGASTFSGAGKQVQFTADNNFIILSTKGLYRFSIGDSKLKKDSLVYTNIKTFITGKNGEIYIPSGDTVKKFNQWNELENAGLTDKDFISDITSIAVDATGNYTATGNYNGVVFINHGPYREKLNLSSVNALKFGLVNNRLQLAAAGADQTISLIDVDAAVSKSANEDIITLKGHTKWIYALCYSTDGKWLFSCGEDNKVMAWQTSMGNLYNSINK